MRRLRNALLPAGLALVATTSMAGAAPTAVDLQIDIVAGTSLRGARFVPNGGSATLAGPTFWAGVELSLITPQPASARIRFELAEGLRWGRDEPDPTEQCTATPTTGVCQSPQLQPISGGTGSGWAWEIIAARAGSYVLRAEILDASDTDPVESNNTASVTIVVTEPSTGGGSGGGGGTATASVSAGAVKLSPAKPKAGSTLVASVRVTRGGAPVKPAGIACSATIGKTKVKGGAKSSSGLASCLFKTPRSGKGKTMLGSVSFTAGGQSFTKRFSARLG